MGIDEKEIKEIKFPNGRKGQTRWNEPSGKPMLPKARDYRTISPFGSRIIRYGRTCG